jgi:hypothetical protein
VVLSHELTLSHEKSREQKNTLETPKISDEEHENLRNVGKGG